jgi:hypothetical protein
MSMTSQPAVQAGNEQPPLDDLADQINKEHAAATSALKDTITHAYQCGKLLIKRKDEVAHGQWLPWLAKHCPTIPERTAQYYMAIARDPVRFKSATVADLTVRKAAKALPAAPSPKEVSEIEPGNSTPAPAEAPIVVVVEAPEIAPESGDDDDDDQVPVEGDAFRPERKMSATEMQSDPDFQLLAAVENTIALLKAHRQFRARHWKVTMKLENVLASVKRALKESGSKGRGATPEDPANCETANEVYSNVTCKI